MKKYLMPTLIVIAVLVLAFAIMTTSGKGSKSGFLIGGAKLAQVNNDIISEDLLKIVTQGQMVPDENKKVIIDELVDNFLVYQEALKSEVAKDSALVNQIEMQKRLLIASKFIESKVAALPAVTEEEISAYYLNCKDKVDKKVKIEIIALAPDRAAADSLYNLILTKKKTFEQVAKESSLDKTTGEKGGLVDGYYMYKQWASSGLAVLDSVVFSLKNRGEMSVPFAEVNGTYMIVKLVDFIPSNLDFNQIKGYLMNIIYSDRNKTYIAAYVSELKTKAKVTYFENK